jgi:hypothetical protein
LQRDLAGQFLNHKNGSKGPFLFVLRLSNSGNFGGTETSVSEQRYPAMRRACASLGRALALAAQALAYGGKSNSPVRFSTR